MNFYFSEYTQIQERGVGYEYHEAEPDQTSFEISGYRIAQPDPYGRPESYDLVSLLNDGWMVVCVCVCVWK